MTEAIDATGGRWFSLHLFPRFARATGEDTDAFLVEDLAPLLDGLVSDRRATSWFYVRHVDVDGPHLRVRVRDLTPAGVAALHAEATLLVKERLGEGAEVHEAPYVPETERFGGPAALPVTEDVFALSTRVALDGLARTGHGGERLALAGTSRRPRRRRSGWTVTRPPAGCAGRRRAGVGPRTSCTPRPPCPPRAPNPTAGPRVRS